MGLRVGGGGVGVLPVNGHCGGLGGEEEEGNALKV